MVSRQSLLRSVKRFGLSADLLKLIAILCVLVDNFAVVVIQNGKLYGYSEEYYAMALATEEGQRWLWLYRILRVLGTLAAPIFCFLLVQGFEHSRSLRRYFVRLAALALVSELPYDLAMHNATYDFSSQNPCFTLALSLGVLMAMRHFRRNAVLKWGCTLLGCVLAWLIRADYGVAGVLMTALMCNFRREKGIQTACGAVISAAASLPHFGIAALAFVPIWFYSGARGAIRLTWLPYLCYPLELVIFYTLIYIGAMM